MRMTHPCIVLAFSKCSHRVSPGHVASEHLTKACFLRAALSDNVKDKPVGVEILGEKVVLFREASGKVVAINDVCPHRGAPLHMGWTSQVDGHDCVVCPYHGSVP